MCVVRTRRYIPEAMERETMECGAMGEGQKKKRRKEANIKWVKKLFLARTEKPSRAGL